MISVNEAAWDRFIRADLGVSLVLIALLAFPAYSIAWFLVLAAAAVLIVTALVGYCPLYQVIGVRTCRVSPVKRGMRRH